MKHFCVTAISSVFIFFNSIPSGQEKSMFPACGPERGMQLSATHKQRYLHEHQPLFCELHLACVIAFVLFLSLSVLHCVAVVSHKSVSTGYVDPCCDYPVLHIVR